MSGLKALVVALGVGSTGCAAALSGPFTPPEQGGAEWVEVKSPHFVLYSDQSASDARQATEELERMYEMLQTVPAEFNKAQKPKIRMTVVLFRRKVEYEYVAPRNTAGFFSPGANLAAIYGDLTNEVRATLQHELTHRFVSFYYPKAPIWLNEGLAEYYETLAFEDGHVYLGRTQSSMYLRGGPTWSFESTEYGWKAFVPTSAVPSIEELVGLEPKAFLSASAKPESKDDDFEDQKRAVANRAGAWALVHFLKNGPETYRSYFDVYMTKLGEGQESPEAWSGAFLTVGLEEMENDFRSYITPKRIAVSVSNLVEVTVLRTPYQAPAVSIDEERAMSPAEVHLLWARLRKDQRQAEIEAAIQLDPGFMEARLMKAQLAAAQGDLDGAEHELLYARSIAPKDPKVVHGLFDLYAYQANQRNAPPKWQKEADALVPEAVKTATTVDQLNGLAWYLGLHGRADEAMPLVTRAIEADGSCWACYDTLALLFMKKGDAKKAVETQQVALNVMPHGVSSAGALSRLYEYKKALQETKGSEEQATGKLDPAAIQQVVRHNLGEFNACYKEGLSKDSALKGRVVVRFVVDKDGSVSTATVVSSDMADKDVGKCVAQRVSQLKFPAHDGDSVTTAYPFVFSPESLKAQQSESQPQQATGAQPFDQAAAVSAVGSAAGKSKTCKTPGGPTGNTKVKLTFAPTGDVTSVQIEAPFEGTPVGECIASKFRSAKVPPFTGDPVSVSKSVEIK